MIAADVTAVADLERRTFSTPWRQDTFARLLETRSGAEVWVAEEPPTDTWTSDEARKADPVGRMLGYAVLWVAGDQGELANLAIVPEMRGQGIGGRLLDHVIGRCRERGVAALYLEVRHSNDVARTLYEGRGFRTIGVRKSYYSEPREDARVMMKSFSAEVVPPR